MAAKRILKDNEKWWAVTELEELFFYTLYHFKAYWTFGEISTYTAKRIYAQTNVDVKGYLLRLRSNELIHFLNSHFHETQRGQRSIHFEDIRKLPEVVHNFTYATNREGDSMLFETRFPNNNLFQLVVIIDHEHKLLLGKSFRIKT